MSAPAAAAAGPTLPPMVDIGSNLLDSMFQGNYHGKQAHDPDLIDVLQRARRAGVVQQIVTAGSLAEAKEALDLVAQPGNDDLFCTAGCHPTRATEMTEYPAGLDAYIAELETLFHAHGHARPGARGKIAAVGECGLDYDRLHFSPADAQKVAFEAQLQLAERVKLPLFLHSRAAHGDLVGILRPHLAALSQAVSGPVGVVHSFDGSVEEMQELLSLGLYIGLNGCSLKTEENLKVAKAVPLDRLMLETDAPWCEMRPTHASAAVLDPFKAKFAAPKPAKQKGKTSAGVAARAPVPPAPGPSAEEKAMFTAYFPAQVKKEKWVAGSSVRSRNEPSAIGQVALVIAGLQGVPVDRVAQQATHNARHVFRL